LNNFCFEQLDILSFRDLFHTLCVTNCFTASNIFNIFQQESKFSFNSWLMNSFIYQDTSQPGPGSTRKKFNELTSTIWTFYITQSFLSCDPFEFWSLGYPGVGGVIVVLKTFPELVQRSVQNLVEIGPAVCTWKGDIGTKSPFIYLDKWKLIKVSFPANIKWILSLKMKFIIRKDFANLLATIISLRSYTD